VGDNLCKPARCYFTNFESGQSCDSWYGNIRVLHDMERRRLY